ncbi:MAG: hypothetical protein H7Y60_02455 [Rhodospirillaceae bacterium]|nr:hypothetical protein [Rhodospirillales bacterium]
MPQMFSVLTPEQARYSIETTQHFDGWRAASERARKCGGNMSWKTVGGRTYLVRTHERRGGQISLGPRSPETEAVFEQFWRDKQDATERLRNAELRLTELARMNVALRLGRLPRLAAWLLTALSRKRVLGRYVHVVGTHALYAYEAMAGATLEPALMDLDFLADPRRLKLGVRGVPTPRLIDVLRDIDPSFVQEEKSYSVRNKDGFEVDLLKVADRDPLRSSKGRQPAEGDIQPVEIINLKWLLHAPKVEAVAIGEDGFPVPMSVPDPRAFALYKFYLSQEPSRDPRKRIRDGAQAEALVSLIEERLPQFPFDPDQLRMFPTALRQGVSTSGNPFWTGSGDQD